MPWDESCSMDERIGFVAARLRGFGAMVEDCEAFGISRKTGYKWMARYDAEGAAGLAERSHAPHRPGGLTPEALCARIIALRQARPSWGPLKIIGKLRSVDPDLPWPAPSTAGDILKRAGLVSGRKLRRRAPPRLGELTRAERANHVWAVDHKGWIRLGDKSRCEPLTITDSFSRFLLSLSATGSTREEEAKPLFERAFRDYGLPETLRSDNGAPFASSGVTGLTALSVWWAKLGIEHERIDPGSPQQNGRHERFHLTLLEAMAPPSADRQAQESRFARFKRDYNEERPHQALGQNPPAAFYVASPRAMPVCLPEPNYPAEAAVRHVRSNGEIRWRGELIGVSTALVGEPVAVEETIDGQWQVRFHNLRLGVIDQKQNRLRRIHAPRGAHAPQT